MASLAETEAIPALTTRFVDSEQQQLWALVLKCPSGDENRDPKPPTANIVAVCACEVNRRKFVI